MKSVKPEEFFKLVSVNSGVDLNTARDVYYGMVRTITRELKGKRIITLPDLGELSIRIYKERTMVVIGTKERKTFPPTPTIKFKADYKVKKYFQDLRVEGTML